MVASLVFAAMIPFDEEDSYLPIKTAAEYFYCERAAFYMFTRWENNLENPYLFKGAQQHRTIERLPYKHRPGAKIIFRYPVVNDALRIYGVCDAVEFPKSGPPYPIEYKSRKTRVNFMHVAQLHLQAACLEEMRGAAIPCGYIYFVESRARQKVGLPAGERSFVLDKVAEMRDKIMRRDIRAFRPCGNAFCSYSAIDDPVLYRRTSHVVPRR